jgi:hypothetical protein
MSDWNKEMPNNELRRLLKDCYDLLHRVNEHFWSGKIAVILNSGDESLTADQAKEVASWFGGMGSFNDLMISTVNDHSVDPADEPRLNDELERLRESIYKHATARF